MSATPRTAFEENTDVRIGNIACLKSGGPPMTVESIADDNVVCIWFHGDRLKREAFAIAVIELRQSQPESLAERLECAQKRATQYREASS